MIYQDQQIQKLLLFGLNMLPDTPPQSTPGVLKTVHWLIGKNSLNEEYTLNRAYMFNLLKQPKMGERWNCNGRVLVHLIERRIRSNGIPNSGAILIGIGELMARSHTPRGRIENAVGSIFSNLKREKELRRILRESLAIVSAKTPKNELKQNSIYDYQELSVMDWNSIELVRSMKMQTPHIIRISGGFGIDFVAQMILHRKPSFLRSFLEDAFSHNLLDVVVGAISTACVFEHDAAAKALRSRVPFLVLLGVANLIDGGQDGKGKRASEIDNTLAECGVSTYGRMRVAAFILKESVHAWFRQKDRPAQSKRRVALLRLDPSKASGGEKYASSEIDHSLQMQNQLDDWCTATNDALNDALQNAASQNPHTDKSWELFESALLSNPELINRFAMYHPEGKSKITALKKSLNIFEIIIGAKKPKSALNQKYESYNHGDEIALWAAIAQIALSEHEDTDIGRDTAHKIHELEKVVREFTLQPLAVTRFQSHFQSALLRWAHLLQFALKVVLSKPSNQLVKLRESSLNSSSLFMPVACKFSNNALEVSTVTNLTTDVILTCETALIKDWISNISQPEIIRAQLIWSQPEMLNKNPTLAVLLVNEIYHMPAPLGQSDFGTHELLNIFDRAIVAQWENQQTDIVSHLKHLYDTAVQNSHNALAQSLKFTTFHSILCCDESAFKQVLSSPVWGNSRLAQKIRLFKGQSD